MTQPREALVVEDLHKSFGGLEVLKGISMTAREHDVVSILGSSGSGKSTLLRCINLLETPNAGNVTVHGELIRMHRAAGREPVHEDRRQVDRIRAKLGMVFQQFNLWSHMTVLQNVVEAPRHVLRLSKAEATERAEAVLQRVGMYDRKDYYPAHLSGGQQQRGAHRQLPSLRAVRIVHRGRRVLPVSDLRHRVAVQAVGATLARSSARPRQHRCAVRATSHVLGSLRRQVRAANVRNAWTTGMTRNRSHWRGSAAMHGTTRAGAVRRAFGPFRPQPVAVQSPAWRPRPMPRQWKSVLALVLVVLLACSGVAVHAEPDPMVEAIQQALTEKGFDPGKVDGAMGWRTRGALRVFQRSVGLPDSGRVDSATLAVLGLAHPSGAQAKADEDTPPVGAPRAAPAPMPSADAPNDETPSTEPTPRPSADPPETAAPRATPAPLPSTDAPKAKRPIAKPITEPSAGAPESETRAEPAPIPGTVAPKAETPNAKPPAEPGADTPKSKASRAEPVPVPGTAAPKDETSHTKPKTVPSADTSGTEPLRPEPAPERAARPRLSFATLGWHRPQTGAGALARFNAIGAPPDFKRGTGSLFVPKAELVFVLRAGEQIPGLDCDPGAGRLSIEFVFGPDGPVIFTPVSGGEYCQIGIGIAIEVGRTLEMQRVDWGDMLFPRGTVRITSDGLEYVE